jgi:YHS domain-containing protein
MRKAMRTRAPSVLAVLMGVCLAAGAFSLAGARGLGGGPGAAHEIVQTTCPVMVGNKINPNIYTEYKGNRVYFCCPRCKAAFEADSERYLDRIPQFAAARERERRHSGFGLGQLIEPFGVATLSLLVLTFCFGYFMSKNRRVLFKWHRRLAYVTIVVALCHATLVLTAHDL